jgi:prepilin-type N-terminal cleavage/methylation domain-containing protein
MLKKLKKRESGFTLIEIVLVLAIAGLIMVIVFLAVSGAQKARRDTQRKSDAARFAAAVETAAGNANGALPTPSTTAPAGFTGNDPQTGTTYLYSTTVSSATLGTIGYATNNICSGNLGTTTTGAKGANYAVVIGLEQGGSACYDNH